MDGEDGDDAALDGGLGEEAAAALRQRIDERLRQAADGACGIVKKPEMLISADTISGTVIVLHSDAYWERTNATRP